LHSDPTDSRIPAAKIRFIGPRLPLNSLSDPQPATSNLYISETLGVDLVTANSAVTMFELGGFIGALVASTPSVSEM
jgi:hypothetical protein